MPIEPTMEYLTEDMIEKVKIELGPIFKEGDDKALENIVIMVRDEAFEVVERKGRMMRCGWRIGKSPIMEVSTSVLRMQSMWVVAM